MKKLILSVFALGAVVFGASAAGGSSSAVASTGKAELVRTLTLTNLTENDAATGTTVINGGLLDFGKLSIDAITATGTATITPAVGAQTNEITSVVVANGVTAQASTKSAATFKATGFTGASFNVSVPASLDLTGNSAGVSIALASNLTTGTIGTNGTVFMVGGTLSVPAATLPGAYSGSFNVTVLYN